VLFFLQVNNVMLKTLLILTLVIILSYCVKPETSTHINDTQTPAQKKEDCSLICQLKVEFKKRNEKIEHIRILTVRPTPFGNPKYLVVVWGIRADWDFKGDFADELFGLFIVDDSLQHVEKVIDFVPSPRWNDTEMKIAKLDTDYIVLEGIGATYGGILFKRKYRWREESE
jgi:hypothetical protein